VSSVTLYASNGVQVAKTTCGYDSHGRQSTVTDARNGTTTYTFNNADQVASVTTPAPGNGQSAQATFTFYNLILQATNTVLPDGGSLTNVYSLRGELVKTSGARTYPVAYSYDAQGRLKTMTNWSKAFQSGARVTTWNYDGYRGFLTNKLYADTNGPSYAYTAAGRLQMRTWARGVTTTHSYNDAGDLRLVDYSDGTPDVSYVYDRRGRPTTITQGANTTALTYNDAGQLLSEAGTAGILNGFTVTNVYDSLLRRASLVLRSNATTLFTHSYAYDSASRLTNVSDGTYSAAYSYLANSPLVSQISFQHGGTARMTTTKQYDYLNRLQSISSMASNTISLAYEYNDANQRTRRIEPDGSLWVYGYDALGQVTSGKKYWNDWTPVAGQHFEYTFDDIGNRTQIKVGGNEVGTGLRTASYAANSLNQYTSRDVPGTNDIIGLAKATATTTVNGQSTYRRGEYYQKALSFDNTSTPLYPSITNHAVLNGETNILTGNIFLPKTQEAFAYDADGNLTNDGRWMLTWDGESVDFHGKLHKCAGCF
jgi:YD repeat-containing protein